jgi:hypothetical protein
MLSRPHPPLEKGEKILQFNCGRGCMLSGPLGTSGRSLASYMDIPQQRILFHVEIVYNSLPGNSNLQSAIRGLGMGSFQSLRVTTF